MSWYHPADVGYAVRAKLADLGYGARLFGRLIASLGTVLRRPWLVRDQIHFMGNYSLAIIAVSGVFVGFVMGLQYYYGLQRFGGPFLAGERFSAVDAFFCPVAFRVQTYGLSLDASCGAYVQTLLELPAMRQWYEGALAEPWIEPAHDADVLAFGQLQADLRQTAQPA